jgi:hypothetical protein
VPRGDSEYRPVRGHGYRSVTVDSLTYDVFISYSRRDDADGWVSELCAAIYDDFKSFSTEPFRIFFDRSEIHTRDDWELRLRQGLRSSRALLVCVSPNYLKSAYCKGSGRNSPGCRPAGLAAGTR